MCDVVCHSLHRLTLETYDIINFCTGIHFFITCISFYCRLCYVRSIEGHNEGVDVVAVSPTAGDIVSSCRKGNVRVKLKVMS